MGFIICKPGGKTLENLPHYCNNPKLIIYCLKIGLLEHGQQEQKQQGNIILHGVKKEPIHDNAFG